MTYPQFTPYPPSMLDNIAYAQQLVDQIMRNNPLINAVVPSGLMKWYGNYQNPDSTPVNFLWIGEFFPADPNMGNKPQKGFSLVRDDGTHSSAIALFDASPATPLRQTLFISSWDGQPIIRESRLSGGLNFPRQQIPMNKTDGFIANWPKTNSTSSFSVCEGRLSGTGNTLHYKLWAASDAAVTGQVRVRVQDGATVINGPWNAVPANGNVVFDSTMDITLVRGHLDSNIYVDAQVLTGTGFVYVTPAVMSVYSD